MQKAGAALLKIMTEGRKLALLSAFAVMAPICAPAFASSHSDMHFDEAVSESLVSHETALTEDGLDEEHSEGLPQLNPETYPSQIFWLAVTFAILYLFFSNKTLPEISDTIEFRRNHIQNDLMAAAIMNDKAEAALRAYDESLSSARSEAAEIIHDLELSIQKLSSKADTDFRKKAKHDLSVLELRLEKTKNYAMEEMNAVAAEIAQQAARKIAGISPDLDQVRGVVQALSDKEAA